MPRYFQRTLSFFLLRGFVRTYEFFAFRVRVIFLHDLKILE